MPQYSESKEKKCDGENDKNQWEKWDKQSKRAAIDSMGYDPLEGFQFESHIDWNVDRETLSSPHY